MERELMLLEKIVSEFRDYSFYEIMEVSDLSREPTYRHLQRLVERGFVRKRKIGNIYLYSVNLENEELHPILSFLHMRNLTEEERKVADSLKKVLPKNVLFGFLKGNSAFICYSGEHLPDEVLEKGKELGIEVRGIEVSHFRDHLERKGLQMLSGAKAFYNGERLFREVADVLTSREAE